MKQDSTVFIVDDDPSVRDSLRCLLESAGFVVVRIRNEDVLDNIEGVMEEIDAVVAGKIASSTPP